MIPTRPSLYRRRRILLRIGVYAPVFAFAAVLLAVAAYPGFDHARQYLSDLGSAKARVPQIFNTGVAISGVGAIAAGFGFGFAMLALGGSRIAAGMTAFSFALAGIGMMLASYYVSPDPRHQAINLGLGIQIAPLMLIWGLWRIDDMARLRRFLATVFVAMAVLTVITKHLVFKGMVNDANVGWWERAFAVVLVGWTGVAAFVLERRLLAMAHAAESAESAENEASEDADLGVNEKNFG